MCRFIQKVHFEKSDMTDVADRTAITFCHE